MSQGMQEYLRACICSTSAQLHNHEAKIWGLCKQTFNLQQEVDHECHHADKVETKLWFIEQMEGHLVRGGA